MHDPTYKPAILTALANGPMTIGTLNLAVVLVNVTIAHVHFREDLFELVKAGKVAKSLSADGNAYLFSIA